MNAIRLRQLLVDAVNHVPFYRDHWRAAGVDLLRVPSAVHLEFLPVVRSGDLRAARTELRLDQRAFGANPEAGVDVQVEREASRRRRSRFMRALRSVGYLPGQRVMQIEAPESASEGGLRWTSVDVHEGRRALLDAYARIRPHVLYGPLSALVPLAEDLLAAPAVTWRPKLVVTTREPLTDAYRSVLESVFGAPVSDFYSVAEIGLVAYSIPGRPGYLLASNDLHLEFLRDAAIPGFERLVITDLASGAMPLIRFDNGDFVHRDRGLANAPIVQIRPREAQLPQWDRTMGSGHGGGGGGGARVPALRGAAASAGEALPLLGTGTHSFRTLTHEDVARLARSGRAESTFRRAWRSIFGPDAATAQPRSL